MTVALIFSVKDEGYRDLADRAQALFWTTEENGTLGMKLSPKSI